MPPALMGEFEPHAHTAQLAGYYFGPILYYIWTLNASADDVLWCALNKSHLCPKVRQRLPKADSLDLYALIDKTADNFSLNEKEESM